MRSDSRDEEPIDSANGTKWGTYWREQDVNFYR